MLLDISAKLIRSFEGFSSVPYHCAAGFLTVGWGHVVRPGELIPDPFTEETAEKYLDQDIQIAEKAISRLIRVPLNQNQWDALTSFVFNLGPGALQASTLRQVINRQDFDEAPDQIRRWVYAGGRRLAGLVRRREIEARLFSS